MSASPTRKGTLSKEMENQGGAPALPVINGVFFAPVNNIISG